MKIGAKVRSGKKFMTRKMKSRLHKRQKMATVLIANFWKNCGLNYLLMESDI